MTADDELDGELRRLFGDARLAVLPREGAEAAVVAGARRIRRRRRVLASTGSALTAVLLVGGSLALGGLRAGTDQATPARATQATSNDSVAASVLPPAPLLSSGTTSLQPELSGQTAVSEPPSQHSPARKPAASNSSSAVRVPSVSGPVLGPTGYGKLQLGMSFEAAMATGMLAGADTVPASCTAYQLAEGSSAVSRVDISPTDGILRFQAGGAHTPEGIGTGSTRAQLQAAYRDLAKGSSGYTAPAGSGGSYVFFVSGSDIVTAVQLIGSEATC